MEFELDLEVLKDLIGVPAWDFCGITMGYSKGFGWDLNENHP